MKVYTRTGDEGTTGLFGGGRVSKDSPRIEAYGDVDELNALLGIVGAATKHSPIKDVIKELQNDLFVVGAQLASPNAKNQTQVITSSHVDKLERQMDTISESLTPLKSFILPGGSFASAQLHFARCVCRRAERRCVGLGLVSGESVDRWVMIYLNRLSDFLFVLARLANQLEGVEDIPWIPEAPSS